MKINENYKKRMQSLAGIQKPLNETVVPETIKKLDMVIGQLGPEDTLDALVRTMDDQIVNNALDYIIRMHELGKNDEPDEPENRNFDPEANIIDPESREKLQARSNFQDTLSESKKKEEKPKLSIVDVFIKKKKN